MLIKCLSELQGEPCSILLVLQFSCTTKAAGKQSQSGGKQHTVGIQRKNENTAHNAERHTATRTLVYKAAPPTNHMTTITAEHNASTT